MGRSHTDLWLRIGQKIKLNFIHKICAEADYFFRKLFVLHIPATGNFLFTVNFIDSFVTVTEVSFVVNNAFKRPFVAPSASGTGGAECGERAGQAAIFISDFVARSQNEALAEEFRLIEREYSPQKAKIERRVFLIVRPERQNEKNIRLLKEMIKNECL